VLDPFWITIASGEEVEVMEAVDYVSGFQSVNAIDDGRWIQFSDGYLFVR